MQRRDDAGNGLQGRRCLHSMRLYSDSDSENTVEPTVSK
jgi:hypothetical protein